MTAERLEAAFRLLQDDPTTDADAFRSFIVHTAHDRPIALPLDIDPAHVAKGYVVAREVSGWREVASRSDMGGSAIEPVIGREMLVVLAPEYVTRVEAI